MQKSEIINIGTELLMGQVVNTNAAYLSKKLAELGIAVYHHTVVGDNPVRLEEALHEAMSRSDIIITTGGLGPTYDDLSKETIAKALGLEMVPDADCMELIRASFERLGKEITDNNLKQAYSPKGSTILPNDNGTAPGCLIKKDDRQIILLPGPPHEMSRMFESYVMPILESESDMMLASRYLRFFGIGESALEQKLRDYIEFSENPTIAPYCGNCEVMLRITAGVTKGEDPAPLLDEAEERIRKEVGEYLYGVDVPSIEYKLVKLLKEKGLTVSAAESLTGGMIAKRITDVPGASGVFHLSVTAYSNDIKASVLGVSPDTLDRFSAVSEQTAREMAKGVRKISGSDIGIATTGNAGPDASEGKPVGEVYVAIDSDNYCDCLKLSLDRRCENIRDWIRTMSASNALLLALKCVENHY